MRKSVWRTTLVLAAIFSMSVVTLPGCSTSSGFKMPSSDWLSWGKKKPADTALASKPTTGLPAPPSSLASPNTVPSYAQGSGATAGGYANSPYRGSTAGGTAAAPASYGMQQGSANNYPNASYGGASGAGMSRDGASASQAYGTSGASQGFYSPEYRGATGSAGGTSAYARQSSPAGPATGAAGDAYGAYGGQNGYAAGQAQPSQVWGQGSPPAAAPYGASPNAYGQAAAPMSTNGNASYGGNRSSDGYANGGSAYGDGRPSAGAMPPVQGMSSPAVAAGGYRPGSTSRSTQFGTSDNINVPAGESVQPASFAGGGQGGSGSSLSAPSPVGGNGYSQDGQVPPPRTATGAGSSPYPSTYQR